MDVSVRDIEQVEFHDAWRGYNQAEVDDFLDQVVTTVERLMRENDALRARLRELEAGSESSRVSEEMIKKTLLAAQQTADETIAEARAEAERILGDAGQGTGARKTEIESSLQSLQGFETETKQRLRSVLEEQLRALDALTEHPGATRSAETPAGEPAHQPPEEPPPAHELLAEQPGSTIVDTGEALDSSAEVLVEETSTTDDDTSLFDFNEDDDDGASMEDFRPFDDEAALQGRRRRGLFRRRVEDWAG
jgi:cell division initiation protein